MLYLQIYCFFSTYLLNGGTGFEVVALEAQRKGVRTIECEKTDKKWRNVEWILGISLNKGSVCPIVR